jgi:hypothetical protein
MSGVRRAHVVGHDWGAGVAWMLAALQAGVGQSAGRPIGRPPRDVFKAGVSQREKSWYMLLFQFRGVAEELLMQEDWKRCRVSLRPRWESGTVETPI